MEEEVSINEIISIIEYLKNSCAEDDHFLRKFEKVILKLSRLKSRMNELEGQVQDYLEVITTLPELESKAFEAGRDGGGGDYEFKYYNFEDYKKEQEK